MAQAHRVIIYFSVNIRKNSHIILTNLIRSSMYYISCPNETQMKHYKYRIHNVYDNSISSASNFYISFIRIWYVFRFAYHFEGRVRHKQVSRVGKSNYIPQILWDVITCPCPWYLRLAHTSVPMYSITWNRCEWASGFHYSDITMSTIASQITSVSNVYLSVCSGPDQRKHQSSVSLALWGEFIGDRWIPRAKGQ